MYLLLALIILLVVVTAGAGIGVWHVKGNTVPAPLAYIHLTFGAIGAILLILGYMASSGGTLLTLALIFVLAAAAGGLLLLFPMRLGGRRAPNFLIFVHGSAAIAGVACLVAFFL